MPSSSFFTGPIISADDSGQVVAAAASAAAAAASAAQAAATLASKADKANPTFTGNGAFGGGPAAGTLGVLAAHVASNRNIVLSDDGSNAYFAAVNDTGTQIRLNIGSPTTVSSTLDVSGNATLGGDLTAHPSASVTPANNGDLMVQATSNTSLTFKYKGSDGTIRSASLTLS